MIPNARLWRIVREQAAQIADLKAQLAETRISALERRVDALERAAPISSDPTDPVSQPWIRQTPWSWSWPVTGGGDSCSDGIPPGEVMPRPMSHDDRPVGIGSIEDSDLGEYADGAGLHSGIFRWGY